jgi:release factor glutamine methyltransferase
MSSPSYSDLQSWTYDVANRIPTISHTFTHNNKEFTVFPHVFSPAYFHDSCLFADNIPITPGEDFLEIWCGCGVISITAADKGAWHTTAIDINPHAVNNTRHNVIKHGYTDTIDVLEWNLYEPLPRWSLFDTMFWNTPFGDRTWGADLGILGKAVFDPWYLDTDRFITQSVAYLRPSGKLIIWFSSTLGNIQKLKRLCTNIGYSFEEIYKVSSSEKNPVYFELFVCKFILNSPLC